MRRHAHSAVKSMGKLNQRKGITMAGKTTAIKKLKAKYGATAVDNMARLHPKDFADVMIWRDETDPQATRLLLDYTYGGLMARQVIDERTRMLVLIAQCAAAGELE